MNGHSARRAASRLLIVTGSALILVNALGLVLNVSVVDKNHEYPNNLTPGHGHPAGNTSGLQSMLKKPVGSFDMEGVNNLIFDSLVHSDKRRIRIGENWLLWLGGRVYGPLSRTQNPRRIVSGGGGICSEFSAVLNSIAMLNGFQTRYIRLDGHTVSEIRTENGWRVADPYCGVTYPVGLEALEKKESSLLMRRLLRDRGYGEQTINGYIKLFQSSENNSVTEVDVALSPRLYAVESATEWLKWIVPLIMMLAGVMWSRRYRIIASTRTA